MTKAAETEFNSFFELTQLRSEPPSLLSVIAANERLSTGLSDDDRRRIEDQFLPSLVIDNGPLPIGEAPRPAERERLDSRDDNNKRPHYPPALVEAAREVADIIRGSCGTLTPEQTRQLDALLNRQFDDLQRNPQNITALGDCVNSFLRNTPIRAFMRQSGGCNVAEFAIQQADPTNPSEEYTANWRTFHELNHRPKEAMEIERQRLAAWDDAQQFFRNVRGTNGMLDADNISTIERIVRERHGSSQPDALQRVVTLTNGLLSGTQYDVRLNEDENFRARALHILHGGARIHSIELGR